MLFRKKVINQTDKILVPKELMALSEARTRYTKWLFLLKKNALLPVERLLPVIETRCPADLPELMEFGATVKIDDEVALKAEIERLKPWGYGIQLRPGVATEKTKVALWAMTYRSHLITDTVRTILGGSFHSSTVLDMACNHGYFSVEAAFYGAKKVVGVDLRTENIAKANFLKNYFQVENVQFRVQNVYDLDPSEKFDVVYNLGLFYHITDPYLLMQHTYDMCEKFAVIDSIMHKEPVSAFLQMVNKDISSHSEGDYVVELHPTYRAMIDLMHAVGFKDVKEVVAIDDGNRVPHPLYDDYHRRCLIGFK